MKLSDLASGAASVSAAAPSLPTGADLDPDTAIAQGNALFDSAYSQAAGNLTGTIATAAGVVADLPSGAVKQMLSMLTGVAGGAAAGAAMGSVIPGWGTAVGAAVGAVAGLIEGILGQSSATPALQGEFRSQAAQLTFPAVAAPDLANGTPPWTPEFAITQALACPASHMSVRATTPGFQVPLGGPGTSDQGSGQIGLANFTFGVGWVSPPQGTEETKSAAWYVAQAWLGQDEVTKKLAMGPGATFGNRSVRAGYVAATRQRALMLLGSSETLSQALSLLTSWYGKRFSMSTAPAPRVPPGAAQTGVMDPTDTAFQAGWQAKISKLAKDWNEKNALDFIYYMPDEALLDGLNATIGPVEAVGEPAMSADPVGVNALPICVPDTTIVMLAEIALCVATGLIPAKAADAVALHSVMGLQWLWKQGQLTDRDLGFTRPVTNHPNFSRVIGVIASKINPHHALSKVKPKPKPKPPSSHATAPGAAERSIYFANPSSFTRPTHVSTQQTSLAPDRSGLLGLAALAVVGVGVVVFSRRKVIR